MLNGPTLLLVQASFTLLTTLLVVIAAVSVGRRPELLWWAAGNVVAALGLLLGPQTHWPLVLNAVLSYGLMGLGQALVWRGLRIYCGRELGTAAVGAVFGLALAIAAFFTFVVPSLDARLIASGVGFGLLNLLCMATLVRGVRDATRPVMWVSAAGFGVLGLLLGVRAFVLLGHGGEPETQRLASAATLFVIPLAQVTIAFGLILMLTRQYAEELRQASLTDRLTGVLNRAGLELMGPRLLRRAQRSGLGVALLMLDVDHFKQVNDRHGHAAGDAVLRALARRLRDELRPGDLVARYGGEEFTIVLDTLDREAAARVAERLRASIAGLRVAVDGGTIGLSVSMGVSVARDAADDLDALLHRADDALYRAKAAGRDRVEVEQIAKAGTAGTAAAPAPQPAQAGRGH